LLRQLCSNTKETRVSPSRQKQGRFAEATQLLAEDGEDGADSEQVSEVRLVAIDDQTSVGALPTESLLVDNKGWLRSRPTTFHAVVVF
jgi:hypothetical protein